MHKCVLKTKLFKEEHCILPIYAYHGCIVYYWFACAINWHDFLIAIPAMLSVPYIGFAPYILV